MQYLKTEVELIQFLRKHDHCVSSSDSSSEDKHRSFVYSGEGVDVNAVDF